jgi:hypothetical protein
MFGTCQAMAVMDINTDTHAIEHWRIANPFQIVDFTANLLSIYLSALGVHVFSTRRRALP